MIYGFFKKLFPENIKGTVEVPENIDLIRLAILKTAEDHYIAEKDNNFLLIPSGAWNPVGMIPIKNYKELSFQLTPKGEQATEIAYAGERKWSSISAKIYTGFTCLMVLLLGMILWGYLTDSRMLFVVGSTLFIVFGVLFVIAFVIDYFFIFSRDSILASVEAKIIQRFVKLATLLKGANLAEVEKSIKRRERSDFVKIARNKGLFLISWVVIENALLFASVYYYGQMDKAGYLGRTHQKEMIMMFIVVTIVTFIFHGISAGNLIFVIMSNIKRIMAKENIPGASLLTTAAWLSFIPFVSLASFVLGILFLGKVNSNKS